MKRLRLLSLLFALLFCLCACGAPSDLPAENGATVEENSESISADAEGRAPGQSAPEDSSGTQTNTPADTDAGTEAENGADSTPLPQESATPAFSQFPAYSGSPYTVVDGGKPSFSEELCAAVSFETYAPLDTLGRCGTAFACIGQDLMPTGERGSIGSVKPSGWQTVKYDSVDGKYLYNRCHLIGFQLAGENVNEKNLITGTRYFNVEGMLPFENMIADYVKETGNHVLYRVTPFFVGEELVARGALLEAYSVEDTGEGIEFCVYCHNVQPGITIDYATGESRLSEDAPPESSTTSDDASASSEAGESAPSAYVLNTNTKKFHLASCRHADSIKAENRGEYSGSREALLAEGYSPCGTCKP